jgi:YrbI family 3-deoxy-D-manno-octulosonate 8-phosphate phosphatase
MVTDNYIPENKHEILQKIPSQIDMIIFDFDGIFTNNTVIVDEYGKESVVCNRADGLGIAMLHKLEIPLLIISTEKNPVVTYRAKKMRIPVKQGVSNKENILKAVIESRKLNPEKIIYMGNDVNDLECMKIVGISVSPSDAHPDILKIVTIILSRPGGNGAVRELVDYVIEKSKHVEAK